MSPKRAIEQMKDNPLYVVLASVLLSFGGVNLVNPQDSLNREVGEVKTQIEHVREDIKRVEKDGKERDKETQDKLIELHKKMEQLLLLQEKKSKSTR